MKYSYINYIGHCNLNLNFNKQTLSEIVNEINVLEKDPENKYSSHNNYHIKKNGFYSSNLLDSEILKKSPYIEITISRIQELLFNYFKIEDSIDFTNNPHILKINEINIDISRKGDYNIVNQDENNYLTGIINLKNPPKSDLNEIDNKLHFIQTNRNKYCLPTVVKKVITECMVTSEEGKGIMFESYYKHIIYPHYSDTDSIKLIFKANIDYNHHYDKIYPIPYWAPINYYIKLDKEIHCKEDNKIVVLFKNQMGISIPHNYSEDELNKINGSHITINKDALAGIIKNYNKDMSHIFNSEEEEDNMEGCNHQ